MLGVLIGVVIGLSINRAIIVPIMRERYKKQCKRDGLIPEYWE